MEFIQVDQKKCTHCGICVRECPGVLTLGDAGPQSNPDYTCIACGHCVAVCPNAALDNVLTPLKLQQPLAEKLTSEAASQFLRSRRSVRGYKPKAVAREKLQQLVDMARFAPTAGNRQGLSFIIVEDQEMLKRATELTVAWMEAQPSTQSKWDFNKQIRLYRERNQDSVLRGAPHLVLATAAKGFVRARENTVFSLAYLELYAPALGLGSCWAGLLEMCLFDGYTPLLDLFAVPADQEITGAVMVGYPQHQYQRLVDRNPLSLSWR